MEKVKTSIRKRATGKKARAHRAVKARTGRPSEPRLSAPEAASPSEEARPESESIGDEAALQSESRVVDDDLDDEPGIYGLNRGETAG